METANRNRAIISALCNRLSLDQKLFSSEMIATSDITSLFSNVLQQVGGEEPLKNQAEVMKWVEFASRLPTEPDAWHAALKGLDEDLVKKAVLLGYGFQPSEADIVVFSALHSFVSRLSETDVRKYPNVMRWMDYIQNTEDFGGLLPSVMVSKHDFEDFPSQHVDKTAAELTSKKVSQASKDVGKSERAVNSEKGAAESKDKASKNEPVVESKTKIKDTEEKKKQVEEKKKQVEKEKKQIEKESSGKDAETSVSILNIQVGLIRKAWKHPSADSLLVEEIDLGDGNLRQVVSGLAKYCNPEDLTNRRVALITNVKPGKLRDVMSAGLVLCASSEDHTVVEPLIPPEEATIGEFISFSGYDGKPEDVLNPKKKQLEKITPHLYTDDKGIATYKGVPFMTSAGPCTSSIPKASIK